MFISSATCNTGKGATQLAAQNCSRNPHIPTTRPVTSCLAWQLLLLFPAAVQIPRHTLSATVRCKHKRQHTAATQQYDSSMQACADDNTAAADTMSTLLPPYRQQQRLAKLTAKTTACTHLVACS
jgi:hypothetical protein